MIVMFSCFISVADVWLSVSALIVIDAFCILPERSEQYTFVDSRLLCLVFPSLVLCAVSGLFSTIKNNVRVKCSPPKRLYDAPAPLKKSVAHNVHAL